MHFLDAVQTSLPRSPRGSVQSNAKRGRRAGAGPRKRLSGKRVYQEFGTEKTGFARGTATELSARGLADEVHMR